MGLTDYTGNYNQLVDPTTTMRQRTMSSTMPHEHTPASYALDYQQQSQSSLQPPPSVDTNGVAEYTSHTNRSSIAVPVHQKKTPSSTQTISDDLASYQNDSDRNLLAMLSSTVACLREKNMDIEALGCLEQALWLKRRMFGIDSSIVATALCDVVLSYNSIAMQYLAQQQFDQCLTMLRKAEAITAPGNFKRCQSLQILTYNNIGCCYRKLGKLKSALKYLKEAAHIGAGCAHVKNLSITHLNLCAIESQLGRHDLALEHAQAAIFHTQQELVGMDEASQLGNSMDDLDILDAKTREEKIISLAVAYHNLAVELEFNARGEASLQWYKKALQLVGAFKQSNQALYQSFEKIFHDAKHKYEKPKGSMSNGSGSSKVTRPKSANPATRANVVQQSQSTRDVSYCATVASQCYKPVKPSKAAQRYASPPKQAKPLSRTASQPTWKPHQAPQSFQPKQQPESSRRPTSASGGRTSRRRPLSASGNNGPTASNKRVVCGSHVNAESLAEFVEKRWKRMEQELFDEAAQSQAKEIVTANTTPGLTRPHNKRPQSAAPAIVSSKQKEAERREQFNKWQTNQFARASVEEKHSREQDIECGIVEDDEDGNDIAFDYSIPASTHTPLTAAITKEYKINAEPTLSSIQARSPVPVDDVSTKSIPRSARVHESKTESNDPVSDRLVKDPVPTTSTPRSASFDSLSVSVNDTEAVVVTARARHRRVLNESRQGYEDEKKKLSTSKRVPSVYFDDEYETDGYNGEQDENDNDEDDDQSESDLPGERVSHIEYLRKMKELAEIIQDDLKGAKPNHKSKSLAQPVTDAETVFMPVNNSSKLRERMELVRRDSVLREEDGESTKQPLEDNGPLISSTVRAKLDGAMDNSPTSSNSEIPMMNLAVSNYLPEYITTPPTTSRSTPRRKSLHLAREHAAAVQIQLMIRSFLARTRVLARRARRLSRSYIERNHIMVVLDHTLRKYPNENYDSELEEVAAIKIQALIRGRQSRILTQAERVGLDAAAGRIQSSYRRYVANSERTNKLGVRSIAARTIQRVFRMFMYRQQQKNHADMYGEMVDVYELAATSIQRFWRQIRSSNENGATYVNLHSDSYELEVEPRLTKPVSAFSIGGTDYVEATAAADSESPTGYEDEFED